uniref:V-set domain-containing T-cell activation inhibitor 1-like isoform X2 n=1 Tax=Semicossyphus pulcher TaxID=241346 RepID=UPI0037E8967B
MCEFALCPRFRGVLLVMLCVSEASCQLIQARVGDSVLLPCVYDRGDPLPSSFSVFWRDNNNSVVLNIINKKPEDKSQDRKYRGRVLSFPRLYTAGNFSVQMKDVQQNDSSSYECHIPTIGFQHGLTLSVSDGRVSRALTPPPGHGGGAALTPASLAVSLLPVALMTSCVHE